MKTIRTTLSCLLLIALPTVAQTGQPNVEKQVFGSSQRNIGTPAKNTAAPAADKKAGKAPWTYQRKLSERESAKQMFDRFTYGDSLYSVKLRDAANSGNRWAAFYYGYLAETGKLSGAKDYELARRSYQKAVKNTDGSLTANHLAAYNIGLMYYYGKGSSQNPAEALKWFLIAIQAYRESKGNNAVFWPAEYHVGRIKEAAAKNVPAQLAEARSHYGNAARMRDPDSLYRYGLLIALENPPAALSYYTRAADRWHSGAMVALARYYAKGDSLHKADRSENARWLQLAAVADKRYAPYAKRAQAGLTADEQKRVQASASAWLKRRGIRPASFDYAAALQDDPAAIR